MKHFPKIPGNTWSRLMVLGAVYYVAGSVFLMVAAFLAIKGEEVATVLLGFCLGMLSVGLGLTAIGMSGRSDIRHTELLERLDRNVARLPLLIKGDILTPPGQIIAKEMLSEQSKPATQKRLDEDTQKVGYVRGKLFQNEDGSWSIHWGGEQPL